VSLSTLAIIVLLVLLLLLWWSLNAKIADLEAKIVSGSDASSGQPKCCDEVNARVDDIVTWLKKQYLFNKAVDKAVCALETMANAQDFTTWDNTKSNCGHDGGGGRVQPPEPPPAF